MSDKPGILVLTRKRGQSIFIEVPENSGKTTIQIIALGHNGGDLKFGVDAPRNFSIGRGEALPVLNKKPVQLDMFEERQDAQH